MAKAHTRSKLKRTGALYRDYRKKKRHELTGEPALTKVESKARKRVLRVRGANRKAKLLSVVEANVFDPKAKSYKKTKVKGVVENAANRNFVRRNILTKGAVVDTEAGKAKITSRPGQDGVVNAVLVK